LDTGGIVVDPKLENDSEKIKEEEQLASSETTKKAGLLERVEKKIMPVVQWCSRHHIPDFIIKVLVGLIWAWLKHKYFS